MRLFELHRDVDETGVSGVGIVAQGVEFDDGVVAMRWMSEWPTSVVFHDRGAAALEAVHGHGGKTRIVWLESAGSEGKAMYDPADVTVLGTAGKFATPEERRQIKDVVAVPGV